MNCLTNGLAWFGRQRSWRTSWRLRTLCLIGATCLACSTSREVLVGYNLGASGNGPRDPAATAGAGFGGAPPIGATTAGADAGIAPGSCTTGGAIRLETIGGCTTDLARGVFAFAICTCADLTSTNRITTDSFDSRTNGSADTAGSVGVNGSYLTDDIASQLGGSLWVLGETRFGGHDIAGDLSCARSLAVTSDSRVRRNVAVVGNVAAPTLTIDGSLSVPNGTNVSVRSAQAGTTYVGNLTIDSPCSCQAPMNIAAITAELAATNDNAVRSLAPSTFSDLDGNVARSLDCGRYYFDSFGGTGSLTLNVTGRTAIAVGSGISNSGGLTIAVGAGAELDLFVNGDLELSGNVTLGSPSRPAATRVYVAGQAAFAANVALYANLYIPNQPMVLSAPSEVWGAIFAQSIRASAGLTVHYDQSILDLPSCTSSGQACNSCKACANPTPACRNGSCAACQSDSECCPPLYCNQGLCQIKPVLL